MLIAFVNALMSFIFLALVVSSAHAKNLLVWPNIDHPYASFFNCPNAIHLQSSTCIMTDLFDNM